MGLAVVLLVLVASGYQGFQLPTEPTDDQWFAKDVVNSFDGNRSFADNFNSLLTILCPYPAHCTKISTVTEDRSGFFNVGNDPANSSSEISKDLEIVHSNAERLHGCCLPCSCDERCIERGNCCPVATQTLPPNVNKRVLQECVFAGINSYIPDTVLTKEESGFSYFMVTDCFSANVSEEIAARCRQPELDDFGPVYSPTTERIYKNKLCAECNGDNHVISWKPVVTFNKEFSLIGERQIPSTLEDLYTSLLSSRRFMNLFYIPPDSMNTDEHTCVPSTGLEEQKNPCEGIFEFDSTRFLERACAAGGIIYRTHMRRFRNVFCFLCKSTTLPTKSECDGLTKNFDFSFSALLGPTKNFSTGTMAAVKNAPCNCREYYDHDKNLCRRLVCPPGEYFAPCSCVEYLQNMHGMPVKLYLKINPVRHNRAIVEQLTSILSNKEVQSFKAGVEDAISTRWGPFKQTYSTLFRETSLSDQDNLKFYIVVITTCHGTTNDNRKLLKSMMTTLQSGMSSRILDSPMTITLGPIFPIDRYLSTTALGLAKAINVSDIVIEPVESSNDNMGFSLSRAFNYAQTVSKLVYCQRVVLEEAEVDMLRTRPRDLGVSPGHVSYVFREEDGSMCFEDFKHVFLASSGVDPWARGYRGIVMATLVIWTA